MIKTLNFWTSTWVSTTIWAAKSSKFHDRNSESETWDLGH